MEKLERAHRICLQTQERKFLNSATDIGASLNCKRDNLSNEKTEFERCLVQLLFPDHELLDAIKILIIVKKHKRLLANSTSRKKNDSRIKSAYLRCCTYADRTYKVCTQIAADQSA